MERRSGAREQKDNASYHAGEDPGNQGTQAEVVLQLLIFGFERA